MEEKEIIEVVVYNGTRKFEKKMMAHFKKYNIIIDDLYNKDYGTILQLIGDRYMIELFIDNNKKSDVDFV